MKIQLKLAALALLLSTLNTQLSTVFAQGSLTPPGAPAATMKSLAQIEPRTPISSAPYTIANSGSYYLTGNITVSSGTAIIVAANGVTLDLSGFTITSTAASATGNAIILNSGLRNITILNGFIQSGVTNNGSGVYSGSGFGYGITYSGTAPVNVLVSRVAVSGCLNSGIYLGMGDSTLVESCVVRTAGGYGISASTIKASSAIDCGDHAIIGDQVSDCRGEASGGGYGVIATTAHNCLGTSGSGSGISATTAQNCYGSSSLANGISATTAQNCYGSSSSGYGLYVYNAQNCYGNSGSSYGLYASRTAIGCHGSSSGAGGLFAQNAAFCTGYRSGGRAIEATIANGCYAVGGTNLITYKYNMP